MNNQGEDKVKERKKLMKGKRYPQKYWITPWIKLHRQFADLWLKGLLPFKEFFSTIVCAILWHDVWDGGDDEVTLGGMKFGGIKKWAWCSNSGHLPLVERDAFYWRRISWISYQPIYLPLPFVSDSHLFLVIAKTLWIYFCCLFVDIVNRWGMPSTGGGYREFHINSSIFSWLLLQYLISSLTRKFASLPMYVTPN